MKTVENTIDYANYSPAEVNTMAKICCQKARRFEDAGSYATAESVMQPFWNGVGTRPHTEHLEEDVKAEILLRCGVIAGWIGNNKSIPHSQEWAKDLISESLFIFESLGLAEKAVESQIELAPCYWRGGAFDEARIFLSMTIEKIKFDESIGDDIKALAYLRRAVLSNDEALHREAIYYLEQGNKFFDSDKNPSLKGKYHNQMGIALQSIGDSQNNPEFLDRALIEYSAAGIYFEEAGHKRYTAFVENNIGMVYLSLKKFAEAHEHFETAKKIFTNLKEHIFVAQVEESIAKALIGQNLPDIAENFARKSSATFEKAERFALMIESQITLGIALSRMKKFEQARIEFENAEQIAVRMTLPNLAGLAVLTLLEELKSQFSHAEFTEYYNKADRYFGSHAEIEMLRRLRNLAKHLINDNHREEALAAANAAGKRAASADMSEEMENIEEKINEIIDASQTRFHKTVEFTPEAIAAMKKLFLGGNIRRLEKLVERTVEKSETGAVITSDAVEVVALRNSPEADFAFPWQNLSLRELTQNIEKRLIQLALKEAGGKITGAAKLLGFKHYEMLHSIIKSRHTDLLEQRIPPVKRRKSIIKKSK
ncbi:MAG TPA: tetratricopeptide repeat protein [Pyrinomonadaceae bacterium]|nr:tetratricopeptide repeat protein [Pyrinomonadaceae bacterium]